MIHSRIPKRTAFAFLALVTTIMCLLVVKESCHQTLNRALLVAVKDNDALRVTSLLAQGADPNCRERPRGGGSAWNRLTSFLRRSDRRGYDGDSALVTAVFLHAGESPRRPPSPVIVEALLKSGADTNARRALAQLVRAPQGMHNRIAAPEVRGGVPIWC